MELAQVSISKIGLKCSEPTFEDYQEVGLQLRKAFSKLGFVYLKDHGVDESIIERCEQFQVNNFQFYFRTEVENISW
jgi:isopenicillin N synthase-like dioxygenase